MLFSLLFFFSINKKMALSNNEILNLTDYYLNEYNLDKEKHFQNLKEIFKNHGNQPFYVFSYMSFVKNFLVLSKSGMYTIEVPSQREHIFLEKLQKSCYIQVKKRRVEREAINSEFNDEMFYTINVFIFINIGLIVFNFVFISL